MSRNSNKHDCDKLLITTEEGEGTTSVQFLRHAKFAGQQLKQNACATVRGDQFLVENFRFTA